MNELEESQEIEIAHKNLPKPQLKHGDSNSWKVYIHSQREPSSAPYEYTWNALAIDALRESIKFCTIPVKAPYNSTFLKDSICPHCHFHNRRTGREHPGQICFNCSMEYCQFCWQGLRGTESHFKSVRFECTKLPPNRRIENRIRECCQTGTKYALESIYLLVFIITIILFAPALFMNSLPRFEFYEKRSALCKNILELFTFIFSLVAIPFVVIALIPLGIDVHLEAMNSRYLPTQRILRGTLLLPLTILAIGPLSFRFLFATSRSGYWRTIQTFFCVIFGLAATPFVLISLMGRYTFLYLGFFDDDD